LRAAPPNQKRHATELQKYSQIVCRSHRGVHKNAPPPSCMFAFVVQNLNHAPPPAGRTSTATQKRACQDLPTAAQVPPHPPFHPPARQPTLHTCPPQARTYLRPSPARSVSSPTSKASCLKLPTAFRLRCLALGSIRVERAS